ncbi:hypothetical protein K469DRAFT_743817 [Zopfia rhizophila CBS 207.26]|uniref:Haloacid dehalogenase n=1 Tax=Zopfia rhizophila CBS 207.26 TaxID=1314779 RepID=A0A6A6EV84_9PEZI|nr:hypothetical protein K469DRAFT_743817 [Zopfia rhizophila CBS 207.26]
MFFGTCVNWRDTVTHALYAQAHASLNSAIAPLATSVRMKASAITVEDWGKLAQQWRNSYKEFTKSLATDPTLPWKTVDDHPLEAPKKLLADDQWRLEGLWTDDKVREVSLIRHRLVPWPDSSPGIKALNKLFCTVTLGNGNLSLLGDLKNHGAMDFMHIFSAELFGSYKPSPKVYLGAVEKLSLKPHECAMVAAHLGDLKAAKSLDIQAIYVERALEDDWDEEAVEKARSEGWVDLWVPLGEEGFVTVAEKLGIDVSTNVRTKHSLSG